MGRRLECGVGRIQDRTVTGVKGVIERFEKCVEAK